MAHLPGMPGERLGSTWGNVPAEWAQVRPDRSNPCELPHHPGLQGFGSRKRLIQLSGPISLLEESCAVDWPCLSPITMVNSNSSLQLGKEVTLRLSYLITWFRYNLDAKSPPSLVYCGMNPDGCTHPCNHHQDTYKYSAFPLPPLVLWPVLILWMNLIKKGRMVSTLELYSSAIY